ncbi:MAG: DUF262 domain-containing protein [Capnocytophaga sp.]|nr:DUF262 domain-containing protein [Capnocytophaga sp.]
MAKKFNVDELDEQIKKLQQDYNYNLREYTVEIALEKFKGKNFDVSKEKNKSSVIFVPEYQREFIWKNDMKCKFIESLMLGIPMPPLFAFTLDESGNMELIDGVQRLTTIKEFVDNKFVIRNLELLDRLNGYKFKDLHPSRQRKFKDLGLRIFVFSERADAKIRADIYNRINSTGKKLTESEIRKGAFMNNNFYSFIIECSESEMFNNLFSSAKADEKLRGEKEELISRFFAYSDSYRNFVHSVKHFINNYIVETDKIFNENEKELKRNELNKTLNFIEEHFPNGFRKDATFKAIPRVRFEAISVGVNLALRENPNLTPSYMEWLDSNEFKTHTTSDAANNKSKLVGRIEFVRDCLLGKINKEDLTFSE